MTTNNYSLTLTNAIKKELQFWDLPYSLNPSTGIFTTEFSTEKIQYVRCFIQADNGCLKIYSNFPETVDVQNEKLVKRINEFVVRANQTILFPRIELNLETGIIRFYLCTDLEGFTLNGDFMRELVLTYFIQLHFSLVAYTKGIYETIQTEEAVKDIVKRCENN